MNDDDTLLVITTPPPPRSLYQRHGHLLHGRVSKLIVVLLITGGLSTLLWQLLPLIYRFWDYAIRELLASLALDDARLITANILVPAWSDLETAAIHLPLAAPTIELLGAHLAVAVLIYLFAAALRAPFRAPLRLLAAFHALGALASFALPGGAAYSIEEHTRSLSVFTQGLLLLLPLVMATTHAIIERSNERRILASVLIALWLILTLPVKLVAHALLIQSVGGLIMPSLFLVCGPALDILAVTAIYAWAVTWRHGQG